MPRRERETRSKKKHSCSKAITNSLHLPDLVVRPHTTSKNLFLFQSVVDLNQNRCLMPPPLSPLSDSLSPASFHFLPSIPIKSKVLYHILFTNTSAVIRARVASKVERVQGKLDVVELRLSLRSSQPTLTPRNHATLDLATARQAADVGGRGRFCTGSTCDGSQRASVRRLGPRSALSQLSFPSSPALPFTTDTPPSRS